MQMNNLAELITAKHYLDRWSDPRLVVAVLHNNDLNQVTWEMRAMGGAPKFEESQRLPDIDYAAFAASIGLGAETVTEPGEMADAWERALSADRPYVLDVHCDPNVPPIPPHTTFEQAKLAATALVKGDADKWGVAKEGLKTAIHEVLPHPRKPS
jgi:pyruvate dehydrogenase (quinone)